MVEDHDDPPDQDQQFDVPGGNDVRVTNPMADTDQIEEIEGTLFESPAIRQIKQWVARRTRTQVVALSLISVLALGPAFALVMILRSDTKPVNEVLPGALPSAENTQVVVSLLALSPNQGDLRARFSVNPATDLLDEDGRLLEPMSLVINGDVREFRAEEVVRPFDQTLSVSAGSITRYPFDRYSGPLIVFANTGVGKDQESIPVSTTITSVVGDFNVGARIHQDGRTNQASIGLIEWSAGRPATTTVYAIWLMVLMWALAVTGLLIVWSVIMWMVDLPMWVFGYFVGVLFALPPLHDSLPGRPPPGSLFDFVSFYWSITIIGVSLILLLSTWLTRTKAEHRLRSLDPKEQPKPK